MILDYVPSIILFAFFIYHVIYVRESNKQINRLMKAIMAKNLQEYDVSQKVEHEIETPKNIKDKMTEMPEFIPAEEASDELFEKHIQGLMDNA